MTDPFLIAHLVRSAPAFDIASQMPCPECSAVGCGECDDLGYWWIIPTSGHRAYPYQNWQLDELFWAPTSNDPKIPITDASESIMAKLATASWPDHYPPKASPTAPATGSLIAALGLALRPATAPIRRRV